MSKFIFKLTMLLALSDIFSPTELERRREVLLSLSRLSEYAYRALQQLSENKSISDTAKRLSYNLKRFKKHSSTEEKETLDRSVLFIMLKVSPLIENTKKHRESCATFILTLIKNNSNTAISELFKKFVALREYPDDHAKSCIEECEHCQNKLAESQSLAQSTTLVRNQLRTLIMSITEPASPPSSQS